MRFLFVMMVFVVLSIPFMSTANADNFTYLTCKEDGKGMCDVSSDAVCNKSGVIIKSPKVFAHDLGYQYVGQSTFYEKGQRYIKVKAIKGR